MLNTDADNQYDARDIPQTAPILAGQADLVVGARPIEDTAHFSWLKKRLQRLGSYAQQGFGNRSGRCSKRIPAMTRDVAMRLNVFNTYTYTIETLIQAERSNIKVLSVLVRTNAALRPFATGARLVRLRQQVTDHHRPHLRHLPPSHLFLAGEPGFHRVGLVAGVRYLILKALGFGEGHAVGDPGSVCATIGLMTFVLGSHYLISVNRRLLERIEWRVGSSNITTRMRRANSQPATTTTSTTPEIRSRAGWSTAFCTASRNWCNAATRAGCRRSGMR
ncbi:MAG: hypothetical protein R3F18_14595 [Lysobacterales bacterium]